MNNKDKNTETEINVSKPAKKSSGSSKKGMMTVGLTAIAVAIAVIINLIVGQLPTSALEIDISDQKLYSVSQEAIDYLADLDQDINVIMITENSASDQRVQKFVYNYVAESSHLSISEVDPILNPTILDKYECDAETVIVENAATGKFTSIPFKGFSSGNFINSTYNSNYQEEESTFDGNGQMTSAINFVTNDNTITAYALTGHGETALPGTASSALQKSSVAVASDTLNLLMSDGIPEDCGTIICYAPTSDLEPDELTMLQEFLQGGGNLMIFVNSTTLDNFNTLMAEYGFAVQDGFVGDYDYYYTQYASYYQYYCIRPSLSASSAVTKDISTDESMVIQAHAFADVTPARDTITTTDIMTTSTNGFLKVDDSNVTEGTFTIGGTAVETVTNADGETVTSSLVVFGTPSLIADSVLTSFPNMANLDIFINSATFNYLNLTNITIEAKSIAPTLNTATNTVFWTVCFVGIIPVAILLGGFVYWYNRRKH